MIVLGIDAGYGAPGMAVVKTETWDLSQSSILDVRCVVTSRSADRESVALDDVRRILETVNAIRSLIHKHPVDLAVVELPLAGSRSFQAAKGMAYATAMTVSTLHVLGIKTALINPYANKRGSTGDNRAVKEDVIGAVHRVWSEIPWPLKTVRKKLTNHPDEQQQEAIADALSTVITYAGLARAGNPPKPMTEVLQTYGQRV